MSILKARRADILRRREQGETFESIARVYGVTRERIRMIVQKDARLARRREAYQKAAQVAETEGASE